MLVKTHQSYRVVVSICDKELIGKNFEEGNKQLDLTGEFYKGEEKTEEQVKEIIEDMKTEDATFNIVGEKACKTALGLGLIKKSEILKIQNIPIALILM